MTIIEKYIERNFGGIEYEIDIDLNLEFDDIRENILLIKDIILDYYGQYNKKLNSTFYSNNYIILNLEKKIQIVD